MPLAEGMEQADELAEAIGARVSWFSLALYFMDVERDVLNRMLPHNKGKSYMGPATSLSDYIQDLLAHTALTPDAQKEYEQWPQRGYLQSKTLWGAYTFSYGVKDLADASVRHYSEMIIPIEGKTGRYIRWTRSSVAESALHNREEHHQLLDMSAELIELRNAQSSGHPERVRQLSEILLRDVCARHPQYELSEHTIEMYLQAAAIHDVGKITVPDAILNKEGSLTKEEYEIVKRHTTNGASLIDCLTMDGRDELKSCIRDVALHHHERYDGRGYPDGLVGDAISIGTQVISLADVYDALVSVRCYKEDFSSKQAVEMINNKSCGVFNPCLLESFIACEEELSKIYTCNKGESEMIDIFQVKNATPLHMRREGTTEKEFSIATSFIKPLDSTSFLISAPADCEEILQDKDARLLIQFESDGSTLLICSVLEQINEGENLLWKLRMLEQRQFFKRADERLKIALPVVYQKNALSGTESQLGLTLDISNGGIALYTNDPLDADSVCLLTLPAVDEQSVDIVTGATCWCREAPEDSPYDYLCGLQYHFSQSGEKDAMVKYVAAAKKKSETEKG